MYGYCYSLYNPLAFIDKPSEPINTIAPVLSGNAIVGQTLTTSNGTWTGSPNPTFTYQWRKNGVIIVGQTSQSYTIVVGDEGASNTINAIVTATNPSGVASASSNVLTGITFADSDVNAFISASGITNSTQKLAINDLVIGMKADGIWSKMIAIYPFVGGTASSHSYNLKNTAVHQITWFGGLTHDANGVNPNGTNGYGNLNFNPSTHLGTQSSMGTYCRINYNIPNKIDYGSSNLDGFQNYCSITSFGNLIYFQNSGGLNNITTPNTTAFAFFHTGVDTSNNLFAYKNNTLLLSKTPAVIGTPPNINTTLFAYNAGGVNSFSRRPSSFFFAGSGITQSDNASIYSRIQAFQTSLSRQV